MRFRRTRTITVRLPPDDAMLLFTARGERRWAAGWAPQFPDGEPAADAPEDEGTAFVTKHGGATTYWLVAARTDRSIRYARITPGRWSGTVEVRARASGAASTEVDVTYDLTALTPEGETALQHFAAGYDAEIGDWEREIAAALDRQSEPERARAGRS